jgi:hypothetical protein
MVNFTKGFDPPLGQERERLPLQHGKVAAADRLHHYIWHGFCSVGVNEQRGSSMLEFDTNFAPGRVKKLDLGVATAPVRVMPLATNRGRTPRQYQQPVSTWLPARDSLVMFSGPGFRQD